MLQLSKISKSPQETKKIASALIEKIKGKGFICLHGNLGAGKTTFTKGCGQALGIPEREIKSPSFTYIREHKKNSTKLFHCDFYRLEGKNEWVEKTFHELYENSDALVVVEWSEKLKNKLPKERTDVYITVIGENVRKINIYESPKNSAAV